MLVLAIGASIAAHPLHAPAASEAGEVRPVYTVIDLGTFGGPLSNAFAVNDRSEVAGRGETPSLATKGFFWRDGRLTDIGALNASGNGTTGLAINDRGEIAGDSMAPDPQFQGNSAMPFYWSEETGMINLGQDLTRTGTGRARGINNSGVVVGVWRKAAFRWSRAEGYREMEFLPDALWKQAEALAVNDAGVATGWATDPQGRVRPVRWRPDGTIERLAEHATGWYGQGNEINASGAIAGEADRIIFDNVRRTRPVVWHPDGSIEEIPLVQVDPPLDMGRADGINDRGEIVGMDSSSAWGDGRQVGWIRDPQGRKTVLNDLIDPSVGWDIRIPLDINNHGDIVGIGKLTKDGVEYPGRAFLMRKTVTVIGDSVRITGHARFAAPSQQVGASDRGSSPAGPAALGMDLASARLQQRDQHHLVAELGIHDMPENVPPEVVHYEWPFEIRRGGQVVADLTLQAIRSAQAQRPGSLDPVFRLLECTPDPAGAQCTQRATLQGAFTSEGVRFVIPLSAIDGVAGGVMTQGRDVVSTSIGASGVRSGIAGDRMGVSDFTIHPATVSLGIAPAGTPDHEVPLTRQATVYADGTYSGSVPRPTAPGEYVAVAKACLGPDSCRLVSHRLTIAS